MLRPILAAALLLGMAMPAFAHAHLERATPQDAAVVQTPPAAVTLTFTQGVEPALSSIAVKDAQGEAVKLPVAQPVDGDAKTLRVSLPVLKPGRYTVEWAVTSVDTHRSSGHYGFTVAP